MSFRLSRFIRIGVPVDFGRPLAARFPAWLGWTLFVLVILGVARGFF